MKKTNAPLTVLALLTLTALTACQTMPKPDSAKAMLEPKSGSQVKGEVSFTQAPEGVWIVADLSGLKPNAEHGFHVHDKGDCFAPDGTSAGGHFNPAGAPHGHAGGPHHAGDMPNLRADATGRATYRALVTGLTLEGPQGILRRAVVVHRDPDDYHSQPAGNSGPRIACGVIQR